MTPKEFFNLRYYKENLVGKKILLDGTMRTLQKIYDTFMEYRNASKPTRSMQESLTLFLEKNELQVS